MKIKSLIFLGNLVLKNIFEITRQQTKSKSIGLGWCWRSWPCWQYWHLRASNDLHKMMVVLYVVPVGLEVR